MLCAIETSSNEPLSTLTAMTQVGGLLSFRSCLLCTDPHGAFAARRSRWSSYIGQRHGGALVWIILVPGRGVTIVPKIFSSQIVWNFVVCPGMYQHNGSQSASYVKLQSDLFLGE